jgi:hypothetical protein
MHLRLGERIMHAIYLRGVDFMELVLGEVCSLNIHVQVD